MHCFLPATINPINKHMLAYDSIMRCFSFGFGLLFYHGHHSNLLGGLILTDNPRRCRTSGATAPNGAQKHKNSCVFHANLLALLLLVFFVLSTKSNGVDIVFSYRIIANARVTVKLAEE